MSTIFKQIIDKKIPAKILYEDDDMIAIQDAFPVAPVHVLVIPKKEIESLDKATEEDIFLLGKIQYRIALLAKELGVDKTGYRVITNIGDDGRQTVKHIHYHLIGGRRLGTDI